MAEQAKSGARSMGVSRRLIRSAGALMVNIPTQYAKELSWQKGDEVRVELCGKEIRVWKPVITHPGR